MALSWGCTLESPEVLSQIPSLRPHPRPVMADGAQEQWVPWAAGENVAQQGEAAIPFLILAPGPVQTHLLTSNPPSLLLRPNPPPVSPNICNLELTTHTQPHLPLQYTKAILGARCSLRKGMDRGACSSPSHVDNPVNLLTCVYELSLQRSPVNLKHTGYLK